MTDAVNNADALPVLDPNTATSRDNADPHPVIIAVHPRAWVVPYAHQWEAEYEFTVEHPASCSGAVEECPVAEYIDIIGVDGEFATGFPEPDDLTDDELAVLDGTVCYVVVTRAYSRWDSPYGFEWDVEYEFTWHDTKETPR